MLETFIDESGTHKGASIISVAAMVGARYQWKKFLSYWDRRYFHAKERSCAPLKPALFDAIQFSELEGFTAWMKPEDYSTYATAHFRSGLGNPYAVCAFACAIGVCKFSKKNNLGKVVFVVEGGQPNVGYVKEVLEYMRTRERFGIESVAVSNKNDFVQLCTADFLAHSRSSDHEWFERLYDTGRVSQDRITPEKVIRMSGQITEGLKRMRQNRCLLKTSVAAP